MDDVRIKLSGIWIATMLTYLLGDVVRIFSGDFEPGVIAGEPGTPLMFLMISVLMVIPIIMGVINITVDYPLLRWINIIAAIFWFGFNLISLGEYALYDQFLLIVSMGFNMLTVWYAWKWQPRSIRSRLM